MKYQKITVGFVIQNFEDGKCVSQEFVAGDDVSYEQNGETIDPPTDETYQPFDMKQP